MRIPSATWRIQFTAGYTFEDARRIVPELHRLGITHIYASPVFAARPGSQHGYDVTDPTRISEALGGREGFDRLVDTLREHDMGIVLDIVPNHMATGHDNPWWTDVLENGASSRYASFFGIDWSLAADDYGARIIIPTLGSTYGEVLENGELTLAWEPQGFVIRYYDNRFPTGVATWPRILLRPGVERPETGEFATLLDTIGRVPPRSATDFQLIDVRVRLVEAVKPKLAALYESDAEVRDFVDARVAAVNADRAILHELLEAQAYRLAWWRMASERINYRRFFDVHELVGVRVDDPFVYDTTHALVVELLRQGRIDGVRVDHIDGLYNPREYLERLAANGHWVTVEKILADGEPLPDDWPVQGTSGYEFAALVNSLQTEAAGLEKLRQIWSSHTGIAQSLHEIEYGRKQKVTAELFAGEMQELGARLARVAETDLRARDLSPRELLQALTAVTAALRVYRTYTAAGEVSERDRRYIGEAVAEARRLAPGVEPAVWDFVGRVLTLDKPAHLTEEQRRMWRQFVLRWQQLSGPVMAKGVEDSTFYVYNPLLSQNEVGSIHRAVSTAEFHQAMQERQARWPASMNTSSTHDTKRSEDVRTRLAVLSEIPDEWARHLARWSRWNRPHRGNGVDANEEYFIYQTLLGVWPLEQAQTADLRERLHRYFVKACREARERTSWLKPDEAHEAEVNGFVDALLGDERFLADFRRLLARVEYAGAINSLAQTLLKVTAPGLPDLYQGTAGWSFRLVDPDNRCVAEVPRPTDFGAPPAELLDTWRDGRIKVFVNETALNFRKANLELFERGQYLPLDCTGLRAGSAVAYARRAGNEWAMVIVPRFVSRLSVTVRAPLGIRAWRDTEALLPEGAPTRWRNVLTGRSLQLRDGRAPLFRVFDQFPVALLAARAG